MNNVKKMVLVEPRTFEMMKSSRHEKSLIQNVKSELDAEMNSVISRSDIPTSEKVKLYNQVLQRYMTYKDKSENTPVKVRIEDKKLFTENDILKNVSTQQKAKAKELISFIKDNSTIGWSDSGEFVFDDKVIPNSNIKDLIVGSVGKRKPTGLNGWKEFQGALNALQAPNKFLSPTKKAFKRRTFKWEPYR